MKIWFTKEFWQYYYNRHRNVFRYWFAVLSSRPVVISAKIAFGAFMGICVFKIIRLILLLIWGTATLPVTDSPISLLGFIFFGAVGGVFISESIIMTRVFNAMVAGKKENPALISEPVIPVIQPVATAAVAPVATLAVPNKFPYKIPAGRSWGNLKIQFIDNENVLINVDKWSHRTSFAYMNMADTRKKEPTPSKQWLFLKALADAGGEIGFGDGEARMGFKKQKSILTETLKKYFDLGGDPFYPYDQFHKYKTQFILISNAAEDGLPMVRNISTIEKKDLFEDDGEPLEEGIPEPISDEEEDDRLTDSLLDQQEAQRYGYHIEGG